MKKQNRQNKQNLNIDILNIIANGGATLDKNGASVNFKNGSSGSFSAYMLDDLKTDSAVVDIYDNDTGEILYINE